MHLNELYTILKENFENSALFKDLKLISNNYNNFFLDPFKKGSIEETVKYYECLGSPKVTCGIITYNEEKNIKRCLKSIEEEFDEIIIVDGGSIDKTQFLVNKYFPKIKLYIEPWENNFSLQRNKVIQYCCSDWIFFVDADNYMKNSEKKQVKRIAKVISFLNIQGVISPYIIEHDNSYSIETRKMFRKEDGIKFFGKVHEEPLYKWKSSPQNIVANFNLFHDGYKHKKQHEKTVRNLKLVKEMMKEEKENPKWNYFYARALCFLDQDKEVIKASLLQGLKLFDRWEDKRYYPHLIYYLCKISYETNDYTNLKKYIVMLDNCTNSLCSDVDYFNTLILLTSIQYKLKSLNDILAENNNKYSSEDYFSFTNHAHDHINVLRFQIELMLGEYENALSIIEKVKTKKAKEDMQNEIIVLNKDLTQYIKKTDTFYLGAKNEIQENNS
ncbi:SunS family peptide S-glycosyltransferase [Bacillus sp. CLL-7-23]|uniref:SunS family peptide S-glycosyltransferase n=1 Tax=Bacillus changyiensis TaxID=3004103 RepID=A0ABT4X6X4_9BACI|nr:SunS family peptide S-glycosyltransferase [Bacillus changyiensis]MDA7027082.1 SunS family peptide S-glycosyltransferase [Bacillus changyiensis]